MAQVSTCAVQKKASKFHHKTRLTCNAYTEEPFIDWHIGNGSILDEQGLCNDENFDLAFNSNWHNTPSDKLHINNQSSTPLKLNHDSESAPDLSLVQGDVELVDCGVEFGFPFVSGCAIEVPESSDPTIDAICDYGTDVSKTIRHFIKTKNKQGIIDLLECVDKGWTYKVLVGTYIDKKQYDLALATLAKIPDTPAENAEFKAIYYAIIDLYTGGTGKTSMAINTLELAVQNEASEFKNIAESLHSSLFNAKYSRSSAKVGSDGRSIKSYDSAKNIKLSPNPANTFVQIERLDKLESNESLLIFDLKGQLILSEKINQNKTSIDIRKLPIGIYFVRLGSSSKIEKLMIVR